MPDRDVATIKDPIYYQYAKIKAKSAFAASDGEKQDEASGRQEVLWLHPAAPPICRCRNCSGTAGIGDLDGNGVITVLDVDAVIR